MPRNITASNIGNGVISLLWQLRCHCIPDHDKFSSLSNKTVVAIFLNVCLWRRSYAQNWEVLTLKNCYSIEPPSYASAASVVASYGPRFFSTVRFGKIRATCENFLGKRFTAPPGKKFPVRLWSEKPDRIGKIEWWEGEGGKEGKRKTKHQCCTLSVYHWLSQTWSSLLKFSVHILTTAKIYQLRTYLTVEFQ